MSAFTVSREHIDALVSVALHGPSDAASRWEGPRWRMFDAVEHPADTRWRECAAFGASCHVERISPDDLGNMLRAENAASIRFRYEDADEAHMLDAFYLGYEHSPLRPQRLTLAQAFKAVDCFEYQSCEHDGWTTSEASRFCDQLRGAMIGCLPGYNEAPWEWDGAPVARCETGR